MRGVYGDAAATSRGPRTHCNGAAPLSLAAGYAGPLFTWRDLFGPAGRRRSLEGCRAVAVRAASALPPALREFAVIEFPNSRDAAARSDDPNAVVSDEHTRQRARRSDVDPVHDGRLRRDLTPRHPQRSVDREHDAVVADDPRCLPKHDDGPQRSPDAGIDLRPREPGEREDRPAVADGDHGLRARPGDTTQRDVHTGLHRPPSGDLEAIADPLGPDHPPGLKAEDDHRIQVLFEAERVRLPGL